MANVDRVSVHDGFSRVLVWDHRVTVIGHSSNKAACIAMSAAVQTAAAIARSQLLAERVNLYNDTNDQPVYEILFLECEQSRQIIAGLLASFGGIAKTAERPPRSSTILISDNRRQIPEQIKFGGRDDDLPESFEMRIPRR